MAGELVNPYANPYLPSFASQRPVINNPQTPNLPTPQMNFSGVQFGQIHSVEPLGVQADSGEIQSSRVEEGRKIQDHQG